ncbi:MAG TPA: hypothetical protein VMH33_02575 [Solirubrobacterales bacterium]|nr:hypothetical protein [Solirubrobacterales bacterium]
MKKRHLAILPCLLLALVLALTACGGGGSSSSGGSGEEAAIEEAIEEASAASNPAACTEFTTQNFVEQVEAKEGAAAVKACEEQAEDEPESESAEVSEIEIEGSEALAEATLTGGSLGGQTLAVSLVKEGESWKLDEIVGFTELDKGAIAENIGSGLEEEGGATAELAPCMQESIEEAGQAEIEEMLFGGSPVPIEELARECQE